MERSRVAERRERRREQRDQAALARMMQPLHRLPAYELVGPEGIELIHHKSMEILSEIGIAFLDDEAVAILQAHGVEVRDQVAYFDPAQVLEMAAKAPSRFTQLARNPENNVVLGGEHLCFAPVYGPPYVQDRDFGRRPARLVDFENFVKLAYLSPWIHHSGGTVVEPTDLPVSTRHLDMVFSHIKYSDKAFMGSVTSAENAADSLAMAEIVFGAEPIRQQPALLSLINISSPRRLDDRMLGALKVYARARQAVIITPFILSGAMSPVSVAGTLAQLNAEALAGIVFSQMVEPGTPVVYGSFQTNVDLQSGSPVFGSPESQVALYTSAQLARRYGLPFRSGGMFTSSKLPDAQAGYESIMVMLPTLLARVNFVLHAAGWLEGGLTAGYEKFVLDCEFLGMLHKFLQGLDLSDDAFALDAIRDVAPGGHHLGTDHTRRHFRTAFYRAELMDYGTAEQWTALGAKDAFQRANEKVKQLLASYQPPELDAGIEEALRDFMARRKSQSPVGT
jgi:trimethylamine--corrinoid protein Co-methyltransferase